MQAWTSLRCISKFRKVDMKARQLSLKAPFFAKAKLGEDHHDHIVLAEGAYPTAAVSHAFSYRSHDMVKPKHATLAHRQHRQHRHRHSGRRKIQTSRTQTSGRRTGEDIDIGDIGDICDWTTGRLGSGREFNFLAVRPPFSRRILGKGRKWGISPGTLPCEKVTLIPKLRYTNHW